MLLTPISSRGHVRFYVDAIGDLSPADWARSWISYVLGTVIGRFEIGNANGLGCGDFPEPIVAEICKLIDPDGIMPCEERHPQDIAARAMTCLELMLGTTEARERVRLATNSEDDPIEALRARAKSNWARGPYDQ